MILTPSKKKKSIVAVGKRKKAVARATIRNGSGKIRINTKPIELFDTYKKMRLQEPLLLAGDIAKKINIDVNVKGGGKWGQVDASRTAIANAIVEWFNDDELKHLFIDYDRSLLISDARRTEPHKPSRSSAGPRRSKQQSKR